MKALLTTTFAMLSLTAACAGTSDQEAFCERARKYSEQYGQQDPTNEEAIAGIQRLVDVAPAEIRADAETLLAFVTAVAADEPGTSLPDVTAASVRFSTYLSENCGITS